jgi:hypothetical protein
VTGLVTAQVTWSEGVGLSRYGYCEEPVITAVSAYDLNGDRVGVTVIA